MARSRDGYSNKLHLHLIQHRPGKRHGNPDSLSRITCKQCKLDVTEEYSGPIYNHVEELRTLPVKVSNNVFSLHGLFDDDVPPVNSSSADVLANRPLRARQRNSQRSP